MDPASQPVPAQQGPPPGVTLGPPIPAPPPGVTLGPPVQASVPTQAPPAAAPDLTAQLDPTKPEGVYKMQKDRKAGSPIVGIPYSNVEAAKAQGYDFDWSGKGGGEDQEFRYNRDQMADPNRPRDFMERLTTGARDAFNSHAAGAMTLLQKLNHEMGGSPADVIAYQKENPGATVQQAMDAVQGHDLNSQITGPYRAASSKQTAQDLRDAAEWFRHNMSNQDNGVAGWLGAAGENLGELMGPGELMKLGEAPVIAGEAATAAESMQAGAKVANLLKNHPVINRLVGLGLRALKTGVESGAMAGGQTFVDTGGDPTQTAEAAALGAGGGAALHTAIEGVPMAVRAIAEKLARPSTTVDAVGDAARGVLGDRLAATNATREMPGNALPASTGDFQFRIGGTPTAETTEGATAFEARKKQIGTRVVAGKGSATSPTEPYNASSFHYGDAEPLPPVSDLGEQPAGSHKEPVLQYLTDRKPGSPQPGVDSSQGGATLITSDPDVAAAHLVSLKGAMEQPSFASLPPEQQAAIEAQHDDMQQQLADYHRHQKVNGPYTPNFQPIGTKAAIDSTGDFSDAAQHLHDAAAEVYEHANRVTGGQWQALDQHIKDLHEKLGTEPYPQGRAAIRQQIGQAQNAMTDILENPKNGFDQTDVTQAKANFRAKYVLQDAHQAIKPLYGVEEQTGLTTGQYRGFNGNMIGQRWDEFLKANPDARQIIGPDRVDTLQRLFKANGTMAARKRFGNAIASVGMALAGYHFGGWEGSVGAETAYHGIRYTLRGLVANPRIAKSLLFAIDSGARPEQYAPSIAAAIKRTIPVAAGATVRSLNGPPQEEPQQ